VEAVLADATSKIETVFPKEAVKLWQTNARSLLTSSPLGSLFHILESELRISNCFLPPRIELWVHSFNIIGGSGEETSSTVSQIGGSSNLQRLLKLYVESDESPGITNPDEIAMSSPLFSQESICSGHGSGDGLGRNENSEAKSISQPFHTQISEPPSPMRKRQPLTSKQPRASQNSKSTPEWRMQHSPTPQLARKGTHVPVSPAKDSMNMVERISNQLVAKFQGHDPAQDSTFVAGSSANSTDTPRHHRNCTPVHENYWRGGKPALKNGRYLPRYLVKVSSDQQQILETFHAWQPSKADRQIHGSIPNQILQHFTELADRTPDPPPSDGSLNAVRSQVAAETVEGVQTETKSDKDCLDTGSESSDSSESTCPSWSPTPRSPVLPEAVFPENSSPLRAPCRRATPSLSQNSGLMVSSDDAIQQEPNVEGILTVDSQMEKTTSDAREVLVAAETAQCAQMLSQQNRNEPDADTTDEGISKVCGVPSPGHLLSSSRERGQSQDAECSNEGSVQSDTDMDPDRAPQQTDCSSVAPLTQKDLSHQRAADKALVHVQRTPFAHQIFCVTNSAQSSGHKNTCPQPAMEEAVPNGQEPRSSTSFVPGTFMNAQAEHSRRFEAPRTSSARGEPDSSGDEEMEDSVEIKISHLSNADDAVNPGSEADPSSTHESVPESREQIHLRRPGKRKQCSDECVKTRIRTHQPREVREPRSSPALSKRLRMTSSFPSLDALRDSSTARAPSEIARESRRQFFRNQHMAASSSPPLSISTPIPDTAHKEGRSANPYRKIHEMSHYTQRRHPTSRDSLLSHVGSKSEGGIDTPSRLSLRRQSMYQAYKAAYSEYQGDALQFHKACKQIKVLQEQGKAPHPSLWDDFIFRRHHDYRKYLLEVTEACEDALPYRQYYAEHVEKPSRMLLVVKPPYILSLGADSGIGSSVRSPPPAAFIHISGAHSLEQSVAVSSSASNNVPMQPTSSPAVSAGPRHRQNLRYDLYSQKLDETEQVQESSVEQWVELQSREKALGAESPELAYADVAVDEEDVLLQGLDIPAETLASSPPPQQAPASEHKEKESLWCDDPDTPFKAFARSYTALASERKLVKGPVKIDEKGCLKPQLQNVIDISTHCRR
jgi:hypothetical protein